MADPVADEWVTVADDEWVDDTAPVDPRVDPARAPTKRWAENLERFNTGRAEMDANRDTPMSVAKDLALMGAMGGAGKLLSKVPAGRLLTSGMAAAKAGAAKLPIIGPPLRAAVKAGTEAWKASAPAAVEAAPAASMAAPAAIPAAAPMAGPAPKPKLSASQVKQMLREQYGSEKGGRMLYGPARPGVRAVDRQALMKEGTAGGTLPKAAQRAMEREMAASTPEEAFAYAAKAKNQPAQSFVGDMLRKALEARMHGR